MSNPDKALVDPTAPTVTTVTGVRRINVAVNAGMIEAIDGVIEHENVTLTEAVRRLVGYGHLVYRAARLGRTTLILRDAHGGERQIIVL